MIFQNLAEKMESANYSDDGIATVSLEEFTNVDEAKRQLFGNRKLQYSEHKLDNEGTMILSVYNPKKILMVLSQDIQIEQPVALNKLYFEPWGLSN